MDCGWSVIIVACFCFLLCCLVFVILCGVVTSFCVCCCSFSRGPTMKSFAHGHAVLHTNWKCADILWEQMQSAALPESASSRCPRHLVPISNWAAKQKRHRESTTAVWVINNNIRIAFVNFLFSRVCVCVLLCCSSRQCVVCSALGEEREQELLHQWDRLNNRTTHAKFSFSFSVSPSVNGFLLRVRFTHLVCAKSDRT